GAHRAAGGALRVPVRRLALVDRSESPARVRRAERVVVAASGEVRNRQEKRHVFPGARVR
ncbi:MAG: hypothetical protein ACKPEA_07100, partial [Planctomycetota bacterium]